MPLRAFLLFGPVPLVVGLAAPTFWFQCPCGHFCFSDSQLNEIENGINVGFNALAGIFAFRTKHLV